jgi:arsenate reductase
VVNLNAIQATKEVNIDISKRRSKSLKEFDGWDFDLVTTICSDAAGACPFVSARGHVHKDFDDPL